MSEKRTTWMWRVVLWCVVLCAPLLNANAIVYRFDSPAELDDWVIRDAVAGQQWTVDDGVLRITSERDAFETRVIDGLVLSEGTLSWRMKITKKPADVWVEAGVVFRVQPDPAPDGHPAQYVYVVAGNGHAFDSLLVWHSVFMWGCRDDADVPPGLRPCQPGVDIAPGLGGGIRTPIPGWPADPLDIWIDGKIELRGGAHEVFLGIRGLPRKILSAAEVQAATTGGWPGMHERKTVTEWIAEDHPNFGVGEVGIFVQTAPGAIEGEIEVVFDDFKVDVVRAASPNGRLATTWGLLKSSKGRGTR